jgi:hypothetical protein
MGSRAIEITTNAVRRQIGAMGASVFEVGLFNPEPNGAGPEMLPRTWDAETLMKSIPWMRLQNLGGRNIYVRPHGEHNLSMLDDLTTQAVARLRSSGFRPALVVETSPGNFQAWLKHAETLPPALSTAVAKKLAKQFDADPGAADWRHFGRLSGFTNRKQAHQAANGQYPFVRLIEATGTPYPEAQRFVADVRAELARTEALRRTALTRGQAGEGFARGPLKSIDAFRANPMYGGDGTRIDLAYAVYALAHGVAPATVTETIRSRDLSHKGSEKRQMEYVKRTMEKAVASVEKGRGVHR